jgi:hypothetical protein
VTQNKQVIKIIWVGHQTHSSKHIKKLSILGGHSICQWRCLPSRNRLLFWQIKLTAMSKVMYWTMWCLRDSLEQVWAIYTVADNSASHLLCGYSTVQEFNEKRSSFVYKRLEIFRFSQRRGWGISSSGLWGCVRRYLVPEVSIHYGDFLKSATKYPMTQNPKPEERPPQGDNKWLAYNKNVITNKTNWGSCTT